MIRPTPRCRLDPLRAPLRAPVLAPLLVMALAVLGLSRPAEAACPATASQLTAQLQVALSDFNAGQHGAPFLRSLGQARSLVACLSDPLEPAQVALLHQLEASAALVEGDRVAAGLALRAAVEAWPDLREDPGLQASPMVVMLPQAPRSEASQTVSLVRPPVGRLLVDGRSATRRTLELPALIQVQAEDASVLRSVYLSPAESFQAQGSSYWATHSLALLHHPDAPEMPTLRRRLPGLPWLVTAGVSTATAVGLGMWGALQYDSYYDDVDYCHEQQVSCVGITTEARKLKYQATFAGSGAVAAVSAGFGLVAAMRW